MTKTANEVSKLAIIIGIDSYRSEGLEDLPSCKKDAEDVYKLLCDLGYTIFRNEPIIGSKLEGPNAYTKVHRAIRDFFINAEPGQTLLFYFSGHGIPRENELYLAMPEVNSIDPMIEGFSLSNLTTLMNSSKSMKIVSIIDACYSGAANLPDARMKTKAAKETAGRALAAYDRVLDNIPKAKGRCFLLSSQEYERSLAVPNSNSLYTKYLVEGFIGAEPTVDEKGRKFPSSVDDYGNVTPETLHNYVYYKVASEARQVPKIKFEKASDIILAEHPELSSKTNQDEKSWAMTEEGIQYLENEDYETAIKSFDKAIRLNPNSPVPYNYKGDAFSKLKKFEKAIEFYDEALKINPKYFDVLKDKGLSFYYLEKFEESIEYFDKALEINSKSLQLLHYKGMALFELNKYDEAIECYDKALEIDPDNDEILKNRKLLTIKINDKNIPNAMQPSIVVTDTKPRNYVFTRKWHTIDIPVVIALDDRGNIFIETTRTISKIIRKFLRENMKNEHFTEIYKFANNGTLITKWGFDSSTDRVALLTGGIAVDSSGYIYAVDDLNNCIQKFDNNGTFITKWGSKGSDDGEILFPRGIAVDSSGYVYVSDSYNYRIQKFDNNGTFITKWGSKGSDDGKFVHPWGIAVDSSGYVYVVDWLNNGIQKFDNNGTFITKWGSEGSDDGQFISPQGIAVDSSDYVYVSDSENCRIQKFDNNGTFITKWGSEGSDDGQFKEPTDIAVDSSGYVYVSDTFNTRIQVFSPSPYA